MTGATEATITIGTGGFIGKRPVVYARIQEEGGTIKPKGHPFLTIPLSGVKGVVANYPDGILHQVEEGQPAFRRAQGQGHQTPVPAQAPGDAPGPALVLYTHRTAPSAA